MSESGEHKGVRIVNCVRAGGGLLNILFVQALETSS
jgi:hypothetical protein